MAKSGLIHRLLCLLSFLYLVIMFVSHAAAQTYFSVAYFSTGTVLEKNLAQAVSKQQVLADKTWFSQYHFSQIIPIIAALVLIILVLFVLERQLKKRVLQKFSLENQPSQTFAHDFKIPTEIIFITSLLFFSGMVAAFNSALIPSLLPQNQLSARWLAAGLFALVLVGGYLLGSLRRSRQVELLISNLQIQIKNKQVAQTKLLQGELRLQQQNASLAHLAAMQLSDWQNPEAIFREIAQVSAAALDVERVSVWRFSESFKQLECIGLYIKSKNLHTVSKPLQAQDLPQYFNQLKQGRVIAVNDVHNHPATVEFTQEYLKDNRIGAMLDGSIWLNNEVIGVICHEHVDGAREWTLDEQNFVGSITDLARLTIEGHMRQQVEDSLSHQQAHLETIVRKRTATIESNAKLFRFLVERAPVSILYMNIANEIIEMNPEAERISGYSREFAIGKTYKDLFGTEQNKDQLNAIDKQVAYGNKIQGEEISIRCADGSRADLTMSRSMELDSDGNPVIISIGQDMSKQKALEANAKKLLESEMRYSYVVEHAPLPILMIDKQGGIIDANPEAQSAAGYSRDEMIGRNFIELVVAKESHRKAYATAARAMKGEDFRGVELLLQNAAGEKIEYECSIGAVMQNADDQVQLVAIALDISRQKTLQASLITAREAAESADRIKSMFVASMSHELRTPLNSIIGFLGVVLQGMSGDLNVKQKDQLGRAYHSARHLLSLITDVIDVSKIEAGFLQVHVEKFELKPLLTEIEQAIHHILDEKNLDVTIDCADGMMLETDRKRLYQVILNVVSNAVKYSVKGNVDMRASINNNWLAVSVKDTGIGIGEADIAKLFRPFERIDSPLKIKTLGTGLGLYLTRKILSQLLSGTIEVQSKLGEGSTFIIKVPIKISNIVQQPTVSILDESHPEAVALDKLNLEKIKLEDNKR